MDIKDAGRLCEQLIYSETEDEVIDHLVAYGFWGRGAGDITATAN